MKHLYLLRHAQKAQNTEHADTPLSPKGEEQAKHLGAWLKQQGIMFGHILCSPALRTRQTFEFLQLGENASMQLEDCLYDSMMNSGQELINDLNVAIKKTSSDINDLLIIAHMPNLIRLCHFLSDTTSLDEYPVLTFSYPSCGLVKIELDIDAWDGIKKMRQRGKVSLLYS